MSDYIATTLRKGSEAVARYVTPSGPQAIRARGDRRRRRRAAGTAVAAVAIVAAGSCAYPLARTLTAAPAAAGSVVPKVAGDTLQDAQRAITRAGLSVGRVTQQHSDSIARYLVISTSPGSGASEPRGTGVSIVVSVGPASIVAVPNVIGLTQPVAAGLLGQLKMQVQVMAATGPYAPPGTVIRQEPAAGSSVPPGSVIVLYVAPAKPGQ